MSYVVIFIMVLGSLKTKNLIRYLSAFKMIQCVWDRFSCPTIRNEAEAKHSAGYSD